MYAQPFKHRFLAHAAPAICFLLLGSCGSTPPKPDKPAYQATQQPIPSASRTATADLRPFASVGGYQASTLGGDYATYPALQQFIELMVQKHGFERSYLNGLFSQAQRKQWTLNYLAKSDQGLKGKPAQGGWTRYRSQFLDERHISAGIQFWQTHQASLQRASQHYGVPPEYILGIMAVETTFGGFVGNHRVIDALTTLSFDYARRGDYFRSELENFLVMSRSEGLDPGKPVGSFAGAMGLGQFMPSSFLQWAVDFNGDGRRDLWNPEDVIGSVANYFAQHGWQRGQAVISSTRGSLSESNHLEIGIEHSYPISTLNQAGLEVVGHCACDYPMRLLLLRHQNKDEYVLGHPNFYVLTRYNHSTYYAMAVHELSVELRKRFNALSLDDQQSNQASVNKSPEACAGLG